ncbi:putative aldehyde dehydrogenase [Diplodia seriata]|uniref:Putative aldehyde dehydrogenase n=1 Tax=Diplodia seriata TaxID=420778 RepID=A0A0G2DQT3_9PEZI|nr:putative aldehyde dehydrogenase [Diplodia seriata]
MPTPHHDSGVKPKSNRQNVRKKRTAVSCDRCKSRKTKCIDPVPGPCHYCASINAPCKTDLNRRKKRPYYHVSEEEYRCMTTILRHYLPDLEFSLPALKALCQRLEGLEDESSRPTPVPTPTLTPTATTTHDEDVFGHVGTDSSIGFNAAIRMIKGDQYESPHGNPPGSDDNGGGGPDIIIQPLATTSLPPATPESSVGGSVDSYGTGSSGQQQQVFLPPLEHASASVQRYFDEVHCLYWLFSTEQFHERVHETYMTGGLFAGASWLCCLYSIFAIGSAGEAEVAGGGKKKKKSSAEYLVLAKALVPQVIDEADVDSVRALSLLVCVYMYIYVLTFAG